ncbi:hypothetical protein ABEB36_012378 [Hypothenemus hampei]|uniref:UDP-glucuronosyltransferase n=1 Tax=Hypothenemus hampei TaxID=57062 RepID=A0ABD1EB18_HYPHA
MNFLKLFGVLAFLSLWSGDGECYKILGVFHFPGISHNILSTKLIKGLLTAGHDVTMIATLPMKDVPKGGTYREILVEGAQEFFEKMMVEMNIFDMNKFGMLTMLLNRTRNLQEIMKFTFEDPKVQQLLNSNEKFDAVILEQFVNDPLKVFAHIYDCPLILLSGVGPNTMVNRLVGNPSPISYAAHLLLGDFSKDLSFFNRLKNLVAHAMENFMFTFFLFPSDDNFLHQFFPDAPPLAELCQNVSLVLLNSHVSLSPALPLVPNMVEIGGYFIDPPKKLPKDLKDILDNSPEGVIYFSLGSNLKSKDLPSEQKQWILSVLGNLKEKVLWKFEEDLPGRPKNVFIKKWLPQQDVLAHPNIKLFITHGGLLSTTETIYHGVPILAIPVFGDQSANADRAVSSGYALKLKYNTPEFTKENFEKSLNELLHNPTYRENAKFRQKLYHDRPEKPMKTAIYWIEYTIRHRGAPHLTVAGAKLPWYKYYLVDVFVVIFLGLLGAYKTGKWVVKKSICGIKRKCSNKKKSD